MYNKMGASRERPPLFVDTRRALPATAEIQEPVSPTGRLLRGFYVVVVIGVATPIDVAAARAGIAATLVHHPRFCSIQVMDEFKNRNPRWVRTTVNLDDHQIVPNLDPIAMSTNSDQLLEDCVASLSTLPMDHSRPLWEFHVLDFPTSEAAATVAIRIHHCLGDGTSLLSLLIACTRSAKDPTTLPAMLPPPTSRTGPIYARPRPSRSAGFLAFFMWILSYFVLACHTVVDVASFVATVWLLRDPDTMLKGVKGVEFRRKRFVNRSLSLDDVKYVKNTINCTFNDVLVGVTFAALSWYYFRKSGEVDNKKSTSLRCPPCQHNAVAWHTCSSFYLPPYDLQHHHIILKYDRTS